VINNDFQKLQGSKIVVSLFTKDCITDDYISWLNDSDVVKYSNQRFVDHNRISCNKYLESFFDSNNLFLVIHRIDNNNNKMIGTMTVYFNQPHGVVDIGIMIGDKAVWGRGYGQDAWSVLMSWLLSKSYIRKITGGTSSLNIGMINLMKGSGMKLEAVKSKQELVEGVEADVYYFSKFRDKY
jgi:[ribosomal protein S5]-alanine N-acetyltransferase